MEDARLHVTSGTPSYGDDLIILDDIHKLDLGREALHLSFMFFGYCSTGSATFKVNGVQHSMQAGDLLFGFGEQIFEDCFVSEDFAGKVIFISRKFSQESIVGLYHLWPFLLHLYRCPVIHLSESERENIRRLFNDLLRRLAEQDNRYLPNTIIEMMRIFYFDICNILSHRYETEDVEVHSRLYSIFDRFIRLLSAHFKQERNVSWYSDQMCLSPKYLSEVVKEISGRSASGWIAAMVVTELKTLLRNTDYSIKEVAQMMNFRNQSFLGKYFKNYTGMSPREYKNKK